MKEKGIRGVVGFLVKEIKKDQRNVVISPSPQNKKSLYESASALKTFLRGKPIWTEDADTNTENSKNMGNLLTFIHTRASSNIELTVKKEEKKAILKQTKELIDFIRERFPTKEEIQTTPKLKPDFEERLEKIIKKNTPVKVESSKEKKNGMEANVVAQKNICKKNIPPNEFIPGTKIPESTSDSLATKLEDHL